MAEGLYHLSARTGSRSGGQSAGAHVAYEMREGAYARHSDPLVHTESGHMPTWAADDPLAYWQAADLHERSNGRLYKTVEYALPRQLDEDQQVRLAKDFAAEITSTADGPLPYTLSIHAGRGTNPHAHLTVSERVHDGIDRDPTTWFKRANRDDPAAGGALKTKALKPRRWLEDTRKKWADLQNERLRELGHDVTVDHRSHVDRGINRAPSRHLGPTVAEMERKGIDTDRGREIREHQQRQDDRLARLGNTQREIRALQEQKRTIIEKREAEAKAREQMRDDPAARNMVRRRQQAAARTRRARREPRTPDQEILTDRKVGIRALLDYNRQRLEKAQKVEEKAYQRVQQARQTKRDLPTRSDLVRSTPEWRDMQERHWREDDDLSRELTEDRDAMKKAERNPVWRMVDKMTFGKTGPLRAATKDYKDTCNRSVRQEREHFEEQHEVERQVSPRVDRHMEKHHEPVERAAREAEDAYDEARKTRRAVTRDLDTLERIQEHAPDATFEREHVREQVDERAKTLEREHTHERSHGMSR